MAVTSNMCCKRCDKILSLVTIKNFHLFGVIECLNFFNMLNIEKVIKIWKCYLTRGSRHLDNNYCRRSRASDSTFTQFFSNYNWKNSRPFWVTECLHLVNMLKIEKVINIWNCDLTGGSPCMYKNAAPNDNIYISI